MPVEIVSAVEKLCTASPRGGSVGQSVRRLEESLISFTSHPAFPLRSDFVLRLKTINLSRKLNFLKLKNSAKRTSRILDYSMILQASSHTEGYASGDRVGS
jgi:hypothetical protein